MGALLSEGINLVQTMIKADMLPESKIFDNKPQDIFTYKKTVTNLQWE
jgi:uncharacterized membrane protein required for colicin V production